MIDRIRGSVSAAGTDFLTVDVGPVSLRTWVTPQTVNQSTVGAVVELHTALIVREDSWTLFGFLTADECLVFEQVQTVSGIGPRIAMGLISVLGPDELRRAVRTDNVVALTSVPGIGRKGAQRLVLELKDRLGPPDATSENFAPPTGSWREAVVSGLASLGWSAKEAEAAVEALQPSLAEITDPDDPDVGALLKAALRSLDRS